MEDKTNRIVVAVTGMRCASCANRIEMALKKIDGVEDAAVSLVTNKVAVAGNVRAETLYAAIEGLGFGVHKEQGATAADIGGDGGGNASDSSDAGHGAIRDSSAGRDGDIGEGAMTRVLCSSVLTLPIFVISMFSIQSAYSDIIQFFLATIVLFLPGFGFVRAAVSQVRCFALGMDTLVATGSVAAYVYSVLSMVVWRQGEIYFETSSMIVTLILFGRYLESKAKGAAGRAIKELVALRPTVARVARGTGEVDMPIADIVVGDVIILRPGEKVPVDGVVLEGRTTVDESILTGECMPVVKERSDKVFAGAINQNGSLRIEAEKVETGTLVAQIVNMVEAAHASRPQIQRIADRVSAVFVPFVAGVAVVTMLTWLALGQPFELAVASSIAVLVVACPCALGLAAPAAITVSVGRSAKDGILVRDVSCLEQAGKIDVMMFDKTGTITEGRPEVVEVGNVSGCTDDELAGIMGACGRSSGHPIGEAMFRYAGQRGCALADVDNIESSPGSGMSARCNGNVVRMGNERLMAESGIDITRCSASAEAFRKRGDTVFYLAIDESVKAVIAVADPIRDSSKEAVDQIKSLGITPVMLTGDDNVTAGRAADKVGISRYAAGLMPGDKVRAVKDYIGKGCVVGMAGDGINDAPALAAADVSFAVGTGTDVAMKSAEITLTNGGISKVAETIAISRKTTAIIKQNLCWAFFYNAAALPIAALGMLDPMIAAGAMALSSVSVVMNSLRG